MELYPIQITMVDLPTYVRVCKDHLGYSPTRGLDANNIDIKSPSAFLYTLDLNNQPAVAIKKLELYGHAFASFIGVAREEEIETISMCLRKLTITQYPGLLKLDIMIISGTLDAYYNYILYFTTARVPTIVREALNILKKNLERAGYNELWSDYVELPLADGTFILRHK